MKSGILLIALIVAVTEVKATIVGQFLQTHDKCVAESKLTEADIKNLFTLNVKQPVKCYLKCFVEKEGYWKNGAFDVKRAQALISQFKPLQKYESQISEVLVKCHKGEGANDCEKAYSVAKCMIINGLKIAGGIIAGLIM